jgi:hypothetical protein
MPRGEQPLLNAMNKVGEAKLVFAFKPTTFAYGTSGFGSAIVKAAKIWAGKKPAQDQKGANGGGAAASRARIIDRNLNLFDPGQRAKTYLAQGCQMMDMYYGQAGNDIYKKRDLVIAEFIHYAMEFNGNFRPEKSGRDEYMETFKTQIEGWDAGTPATQKYDGLTATKEMSRIIRWGVKKFGGTILFEGRDVYYFQVFDPNAGRKTDTDLEAIDLFEAFHPGLATVPWGKGKVTFNWCGHPTVPTHMLFLSNWRWDGIKTHGIGNLPETYPKPTELRPIWRNFTHYARSLGDVVIEDRMDPHVA